MASLADKLRDTFRSNEDRRPDVDDPSGWDDDDVEWEDEDDEEYDDYQDDDEEEEAGEE